MPAPTGQQFITNAAGLRKTKKGKWIYPVKEVDGRWVEVTPPTGDEWATRPIPPGTPVNPPGKNTSPAGLDKAGVLLHNQKIVDKLVSVSDQEVVDNGIKLVIHNNWKADERGVLSIKVKAFLEPSGHHLDVGDGVFEFGNVPSDLDLQKILFQIVRDRNGM